MANLAYGSTGNEVKALQEALKAQGYNIGTGGVFNAQTRAAVLDYQQKNGLQMDGVAGAQTLGSLGIGGSGGSGGSNYSGGAASYGGYNNSGLTTDQIMEMQNYYGTAADGKWGKNSTAAAGGLSAPQAWQQYQQQMTQEQQQREQAALDAVMGFDDFYNRMGGADYEKRLRETINASVQQAVNSYEAQKQETEQDAAEMARQAYVAKMLGQKNLDQRLAAGGYAGGAAESTMLENETTYQNQLAEIQRQRQLALDEIQRAIENARLTGDMTAAEQMAAYMAQVQSYYADYYDQVLNQQMQRAQAAASAVTPSVTQSYTPSVTPAVTPAVTPPPAQPMTSSAALRQASANSGGSSRQTIINLQNMYNNGQITERQLIDLSSAVANPGK